MPVVSQDPETRAQAVAERIQVRVRQELARLDEETAAAVKAILNPQLDSSSRHVCGAVMARDFCPQCHSTPEGFMTIEAPGGKNAGQIVFHLWNETGEAYAAYPPEGAELIAEALAKRIAIARSMQ